MDTEQMLKHIRKQAETDKKLWERVQEGELFTLEDNQEDEIIERMFLLNHIEKLEKELEYYKQKYQEAITR